MRKYEKRESVVKIVVDQNYKHMQTQFEIWREAANLVREVDMDDIAFIVLSLHTKYPI